MSYAFSTLPQWQELPEDKKKPTDFIFRKDTIVEMCKKLNDS